MENLIFFDILANMQAKAYIFDMDGVLADNCGYHVIAQDQRPTETIFR